VFEDDRILVNLSVWETAEPLVHATRHCERIAALRQAGGATDAPVIINTRKYPDGRLLAFKRWA
jgi:hypothetical protein